MAQPKRPYQDASAPMLPPAPDHLDEHVQFGRQYYDAAGSAAHAGYPALATLIRLRQEAADTIERLLQFLDDTEGDCEGYDSAEPTDWEILKSAERFDCAGCEDDEDGADHEPWLGWTRSGALGDTLDLEEALA